MGSAWQYSIDPTEFAGKRFLITGGTEGMGSHRVKFRRSLRTFDANGMPQQDKLSPCTGSPADHTTQRRVARLRGHRVDRSALR